MFSNVKFQNKIFAKEIIPIEKLKLLCYLI